MNIETNRLTTFNEWNVPFIDKHKLALLGFYYCGPNDTVKCHFCRVEIGSWEDGDDILTDHERWSSYCPLIRGSPTTNIPIDASLFNQIIPHRPMSGHDVFGGGNEANRLADDVLLLYLNEDEQHEYDEHNTTEAAEHLLVQHPDYRVESSRLSSFDDWPKALAQKPTELSDAGFFYIGKGDQVVCFACGGGLKNWEPEDIPWEQHATHYSNCQYLLRIKGTKFVEGLKENTSKFEDVEDVEEKPEDVEEKPEDEDVKMCKICFNAKYDSAFVPCGHVYACVKCAFGVAACPVCRSPFTNILKLFFTQ